MRGLESLRPLALLLLRLGLAVVYIYHGYPKLFGHTHETMQFFTHYRLPAYLVYVSGVLELFGGSLLAAGLFTRITALLLAGEMAVALWRVHGLFLKPFAVDNYELPLVCAIAAFALATFGAGFISLDAAVFGEGGKSARKAKTKN